jgi:serine protease Do
MLNTLTRISAEKIAMGLVALSLLTGTAISTSMLVTPAWADTVDPSRGFSELVDRVMPSVVDVEVKYTPAKAAPSQSQADRQISPQLREFLEQHPQFRERFGQQMPENGSPHGGGAVGSGFVVSADGYVVTNNHVVDNADEVRITFQSGESFDAKVIGTDPKTDLALLKIQSTKTFPAVAFASAEAKVGDWVMAVGNPFGLGGTVTSGIISARGRNIGSGPYDDFIQIDASINRGNSGGPAFNLDGEVIGVNTAIFSPSGGSVGIGFAIPATMVKSVVESLKANGTVTRGWLGVRIQPVTEELAEGLGLKEAKGAVVSDLTEQSPAQAAGIKSGDTILNFNGLPIKDARELSRAVAGVKPGAKADVELIRDGKSMTLAVTIGTMPSEPGKVAMAAEDKGLNLSGFGLEVTPADDGAGVKVTSVVPGSSAAETGIRVGDVILEVAGREVNAASDVTAALKADASKRVLMLLKQGDDQRFVALPRTKG